MSLEFAIILLFLLVIAGGAFTFLVRTRTTSPDSETALQDIIASRDATARELEKVRLAFNELNALRSAQAENLQGAQRRVEQLEEELVRAKNNHLEASTALSAATTKLQSLSEQNTDRSNKMNQLEQKRDELFSRNTELEKAVSALETKARQLETSLVEKERQREKDDQRLKTEFEALSNRFLDQNSLKLREKSKEELNDVIKPLKEALDSTKASLQETKGMTVEQNKMLMEQISRIAEEADELTRAFKGGNIKAFGDLGEDLLDDILEAAGLSRGTHYERQKGIQAQDGKSQRLDVLVRIPSGRHLIIDSKATLANYHAAVNAATEEQQENFLKALVSDLKVHFKDLYQRNYSKGQDIKAPDFVLMYMPFEQAYLAAIKQEPTLLMEALSYNVAIVTNTTLLATLRTVSHVWKLSDQQRNAQKIAERGAELYDKFVGFVEDFQAVGKALKTSSKEYDLAWNKLTDGKGNLVRQAEMLKELGVKPSKELPSGVVEKAIHDETESESVQVLTN
jgi:DNA recombination protein RmuC